MNTATTPKVGSRVQFDMHGTPVEGRVHRLDGASSDWHFDTMLVEVDAMFIIEVVRTKEGLKAL